MLNEELNIDSANAQRGEPAQGSESFPEVMTMQEAAKFLGISSRTLDRYVREVAIPYTPLPKRGTRVQVRFLRSQLITWLRHRTVKPDRWTSRTGRL